MILNKAWSETHRLQWVVLSLDIIGWCHTNKVPYGLSWCHAKRRMGAGGRAHPSFGMTPTFFNLKFFLFYFILFFIFFWRSQCHTKSARPSFGMTTTQDIRDLFA